MAKDEPHTTMFHLTCKMGKLTLKLACSAFAPSSTQHKRHAQVFAEVRTAMEGLEKHFASAAEGTASAAAPEAPVPEDGAAAEGGLDGSGDVKGGSSNGKQSDNTSSRATGRSGRVVRKKRTSLTHLGRIEEDVQSSSGTPRESVANLETESMASPRPSLMIIPPTAPITGPWSDATAWEDKGKATATSSDPPSRPHDRSTHSAIASSSSRPRQRTHSNNVQFVLPTRTRNNTFPTATPARGPRRPVANAPNPNPSVLYSERPAGAGNTIVRPESTLDSMANFALVDTQEIITVAMDVAEGMPQTQNVLEPDPCQEHAISNPLVRRG